MTGQLMICSIMQGSSCKLLQCRFFSVVVCLIAINLYFKILVEQRYTFLLASYKTHMNIKQNSKSVIKKLIKV